MKSHYKTQIHHIQLMALLLVEFVLVLPIHMAWAISIQNVLINDLGQTTTGVQWATDESANTTVIWGENATLYLNKSIDEYSLSHRINMDTVSGKPYSYHVKSCTRSGECVTGTTSSFLAGLDTSAQSLNATIPDVVNSNQMDLVVRTKPFSTVKVFIEGMLARMASPNEVSTGQVTFQNLILPKKVNTMRLESVDSGGRKAEVTAQVTVDNEAPILTITNFPDVLQTPSFTLTGHVNKRSRIQIYAVAIHDVMAPSRPAGLKLQTVSVNSASLTWNPTPENDTAEYGVYRDNVMIGATRATQYSDPTISSGKTYNYRIQATDVDCNKGDLSDSIDIHTPSGGATNTPAPVSIKYQCETPIATIDTDADFAQQIPLIAGTTSITVVATDRAGNQATYSNTTLFDNIPPQFISTNLEALNPSYTADVTVRGQTSEKTTVFVYINNEQNPSAFATTENDGTFSIKTKLRRDRHAPATSSTSAAQSRSITEGDTGEGFTNTIKLVAVDLGRNKAETPPVEVVLTQCGYGMGFSTEIGKPSPNILNPRLILKNFGTVGFNIELKYLDVNGTLDFLDKPSINLRPVNLQDQPNYDLDVDRSIQCTQDNLKCYVQIKIRPPAEVEGKNTSIAKENIISDHRKGDCLLPGYGCYKVPLELEIRYQKKQPTGDPNSARQTFGTLGPRIETLTQRVCIPIEIAVDRRIDPKLLPNSLLKTSVEFFDSAISAIDSVLEPLQTIFNVVFYSCYLGFFIGFFLDFSERSSCEGAVLVGALTAGAFNPEVAQNGLCGVYYSQSDPRLANSRENCNRCQDAINSRKQTLNTMHQLCDRVFCPSAPSLQKYITDMQRKGVKARSGSTGAGGGGTGASKEFFIGSDCASQLIKPNLFQGTSGTSEIGIDDVYQLYQIHKNDKPEGDKGMSQEAFNAGPLDFTRGGSGAAKSSGSMSFDTSTGLGGIGEASSAVGDGGTVIEKLKLESASKINCANNHPSTTECCGSEYQTTWGPVCSVMMPDFEITESRCLSAQQTGQGSVAGCKGFRQTINAVSGFCSKSGDVSNDLVSTMISYGKLAQSEQDPLDTIEREKNQNRIETEKRTGYLVTESRSIYVDEDERKSAQKAQNDAISSAFGETGAGSDITHGRLPEYIKDRRVYLRIVPQEGGAFKVERGYVVEKAVMTDLPSLDPTKAKTSLTETLDFVPDLDLTTFFQAPKEGGALVYSTISTRWTTALCSREAASPDAPAGIVPLPGAGKSAMSGCTPNAAQGAWDEVRRKIGVGDKDYIVNPAEDLASSIKCGCIPGITTHLKKWKGIMTAVRNCFNAVLVTGDGTPGACEAVLSRYVCDFLYTLIKCFVSRYSSGFQRPETAGGEGLSGIGGIGSMLVKGGTSVTQDLQSRYGGSPTYKAAFSEQKMVNSVCLFAFTGTFNLNPEALAQLEVTNVPVDSQPFLFPCERRFIQFDVSSDPQGLATWNYHLGADLFAGADLSYALKLKCSTGFDCDPTEGFQNGQCDCAKIGEKTQVVLSGNLRQFENIAEAGEVFDNIQQKWRYDTAILEWQYRDKDGKAQTGTQSCKIETIGGDAPTFCAFDLLSDSFRCSTDVFSEFFAKFSGTALPNYPDPLAQVFKINDDVGFSVPIVQRVPEGALCTGGRTCSSTKYLIYTVRNGAGTVIATNDQSIFDPTKTGDSALTDVTPFASVSDSQVLSTQGERIYTVSLGQLTPDLFNMVNSQAGSSVTRAEVDPSDFQEFVTIQKESGTTQPGFDVIFEISQPSLGAPTYRLARAEANRAVGATLPGGVGALDGNRIRSNGFIITLSQPDKITRPIKVFIPSAGVVTPTVSTRCDRDLKKVSEQTETWTAKFEIRDAEQQQFGSYQTGTQASIVGGKAQTQQISFKTICNTAIPLAKQRGECTELATLANNCHCYDTREKAANAIAAGSPGNCAQVPGVAQACIDGNCVDKSSVKVCPAGRAVTTGEADCTCGYRSSGDALKCGLGETCNVNPNGVNECSIGTASAGSGSGTGTSGSGAGGTGESILASASPMVSKDNILHFLNARRPGPLIETNEVLANAFMTHGSTFGIDPAFLVALATQESNLNKASSFMSCNNMFNIKADSLSTKCPTNPAFAAYTSLSDNIQAAAQLLGAYYITRGQTNLETIGGPIDDCASESGKSTYPCCTKGPSAGSHCYCCNGVASRGQSALSAYTDWKTNIANLRAQIRTA